MAYLQINAGLNGFSNDFNSAVTVLYYIGSRKPGVWHTPMSDVWSFGVVLYEIITFGSSPFQGLSNNQVLEHVKTGQTLPIPDMPKWVFCSPMHNEKKKGEILFRSCWTFAPQDRPQSSEIVEFLANNPRIISPCLDIPLASVQLEGSTQFEIPAVASSTTRKANALMSKNESTQTNASPPPILADESPQFTSIP